GRGSPTHAVGTEIAHTPGIPDTPGQLPARADRQLAVGPSGGSHLRLHRAQGLTGLRGITATALRDVGLATATTAEGARRDPDEITRSDSGLLRGLVRRDHHDRTILGHRGHRHDHRFFLTQASTYVQDELA